MKRFFHLRSIFSQDRFLTFLLFFIAIIPRLIILTKLPPGLHGDEAWTGIDALEVLMHGYQGVYTGHALGQPIGPLYLTALIFGLFGQSIFWLRFSMAVFAVLTIPAFYFFLRLFFSKFTAFWGTFALCLSLFHLYYSRTAFMLISAPLLQIASLFFFFLGRRRKSTLFLILSAFFCGLGVYTYNTFLIFPLTLIAYLCITVLVRYDHGHQIRQLGIFCLVFFLLASPLLYQMITDPVRYFSHHAQFSLFSQPEIRILPNATEVIAYIAEHMTAKFLRFLLGGQVDGADGFGATYSFGLFSLILFGTGVIISLKQWRRYGFFLLSFFLLAAASALTVDGTYRRQILTLPYFYLLFTLPLGFVETHLQGVRRKIVLGVLIVWVIIQSLINLRTYFFYYPLTGVMQYTFATELTNAARTLKNELPDTEIILYSVRWGCGYETFRFLLPDRPCVDKSEEFGTDTDRVLIRGETSFVFLSGYLETYPRIKSQFPGGKTIVLRDPTTHYPSGIIYTIDL